MSNSPLLYTIDYMNGRENSMPQDPGVFTSFKDRIPPYVIYSSGHGISSIGSWMQKTAVGWLAWELTHSPAWVGAIALSDLITALWVAPFAGAITDRSNPYKLLLLTQSLLLLMSLVLFSLTLSGLLSIWLLFFWAIIESSLQGFNTPARMVAIGSLATTKQMGQAVATNSIAANLARSVGPAIAGVVMVSGHTANVFLLNALSYVAMFATLIHLKGLLSRAPAAPKNIPIFGQIASGFQYIIGSTQISLVFFLALAFALLARPFTELFPAIAGQVLKGDPQLLAWLMTAQGIGALGAAVWFLKAKPIEMVVRVTLISALGIAGALVIFSLSQPFWLILLMIALAGFFHASCNIGMQTIAQTRSDPEYKGRVMALYGLTFRAAPAAGAFLMGVLAQWFNLQWLIGVAAAIFAILMLQKLSAFRIAFLVRPATYWKDTNSQQ